MMKAYFTVGMLMAVPLLASAPSRADDSLNSRVCHNISLPERERAACEHEMDQAKSEGDRTKVRKQYEAKIVEARSKKASHPQ